MEQDSKDRQAEPCQHKWEVIRTGETGIDLTGLEYNTRLYRCQKCGVVEGL